MFYDNTLRVVEARSAGLAAQCEDAPRESDDADEDREKEELQALEAEAAEKSELGGHETSQKGGGEDQAHEQVHEHRARVQSRDSGKRPRGRNYPTRQAAAREKTENNSLCVCACGHVCVC